jgi:hypothetical protein
LFHAGQFQYLTWFIADGGMTPSTGVLSFLPTWSM